MSIEYKIETSEDMVRAKVWGEDEDLQDLINYNLALLDALVKSGARKVICDERELVYKVGTFDLYELVDKISQHAPRLLKAAIVFKSENYDDAKFWENASVNKGLQFRIFATPEEAEEWMQS
jgi:hypothetical protein